MTPSPPSSLGQPRSGGHHDRAHQGRAGLGVYDDAVGDRLQADQRGLLPYVGPVGAREADQGGHGEVGVEMAGLGMEAGDGVHRHARPTLGHLGRAQQGRLDTVGGEGGVHLERPVRARVQPAGGAAQHHSRLVLEPLPLGGGALHQGDVGRVGVAAAVDPGGPVRAAPIMSQGVLLQQQHRVSAAAELARGGGTGQAAADDGDVEALSHRRPPGGDAASRGHAARSCSAR